MRRDERAVLVERRALSSDAFLLGFESPTLPADFVPGQFTMVRVLGPNLLLRRPFSFCSSEPESRRFSLLVKVVGEGSRALAELALGRSVNCLGPLGSSFSMPQPGVLPVVVAGGVGIAPFLGFCQVLSRRGRRVSVLLGGREEDDLYLRDDFERLGMEVTCTTEDGSFGHKGVVTDLLPGALGGPTPHRLYSCGPTGMLKRAVAIARESAVPHEVSIERRMGCGMGCCLGCVVPTRSADEASGKYRRTCTEGPVFDADEICWERDRNPL